MLSGEVGPRMTGDPALTPAPKATLLAFDYGRNAWFRGRQSLTDNGPCADGV